MANRRPTRSRDDRDRDPGLVLSVCASEGGGKTRFATTLPKPIAYCSVDPNTVPVLESVFDVRHARDIASDILTLHALRMPTIAFSDQADVQSDAETKWEALVDVLRPIVNGEADPMPASVVFDTATELDRLNVLAEFGKTDQISPESRRNRMGPVNARWKGVIRSLQDAGCHVCLLHRLQPKWENVVERGSRGVQEARRQMTGPWDFERMGHRETGFITSTEIFLKHDPEKSSKLVGQYGLRIERCTLRPALLHAEYWGRERDDRSGDRIVRASFPYLMTQIYPSTTLEDWQ